MDVMNARTAQTAETAKAAETAMVALDVRVALDATNAMGVDGVSSATDAITANYVLDVKFVDCADIARTRPTATVSIDAPPTHFANNAASKNDLLV